MKKATSFERAVARVRLRAATSVGPGARTTGAPFVKNRGTLTIGDDFVFASSPAQSHLVVERGAALEIGRGVTIGCGAAISCASHVRIGDGARLGRGVMILDSDFHEAEAMGSSGAAAPIEIGDGARLDDDVVVLKGARIGAGAHVAAASVVSGTIPDGAFASGVPARVRREGATATSADLEDRVRALVAETFDLARDIDPADGPATIARWDSLGALRLLLALEEDLGVHLAEDALTKVGSVADLVAVVASAT